MPKATRPAKKKKCQVGYPCKMGCISVKKNCRAPLRWQAETFAKWLKLQEERLTITNQKRSRAGLAPATMDDLGFISAQRTRLSTAQPKTAIAAKRSELIEKVKGDVLSGRLIALLTGSDPLRYQYDLDHVNRIVERIKKTNVDGKDERLALINDVLSARIPDEEIASKVQKIKSEEDSRKREREKLVPSLPVHEITAREYASLQFVPKNVQSFNKKYQGQVKIESIKNGIRILDGLPGYDRVRGGGVRDKTSKSVQDLDYLIQRNNHKEIVKQAIAEGKAVPDVVLNDYPELKNTTIKPTANEIPKAIKKTFSIEQAKSEIKSMFGGRVSISTYQAKSSSGQFSIHPTKKTGRMFTRDDFDRIVEWLEKNNLSNSSSDILFDKSDPDRAFYVFRGGISYLSHKPNLPPEKTSSRPYHLAVAHNDKSSPDSKNSGLSSDLIDQFYKSNQAIAPATPKDSSSVSAKSARSRIGKAKTEAEVKSLISQAKREAEQEVTNYKKAIADLYREAIKGISGLETSEAKQEYYQKMNKESQKIADQAMNRFFELTPYRSKIGYDDAPDGMHDKLLLSSAEGAKAWHNGKIRAIGNTGRKFGSDLHDALFNPTLKKSKAVTKTKSKASGETTNGDRPVESKPMAFEDKIDTWDTYTESIKKTLKGKRGNTGFTDSRGKPFPATVYGNYALSSGGYNNWQVNSGGFRVQGLTKDQGLVLIHSLNEVFGKKSFDQMVEDSGLSQADFWTKQWEPAVAALTEAVRNRDADKIKAIVKSYSKTSSGGDRASTAPKKNEARSLIENAINNIPEYPNYVDRNGVRLGEKDGHLLKLKKDLSGVINRIYGAKAYADLVTTEDTRPAIANLDKERTRLLNIVGKAEKDLYLSKSFNRNDDQDALGKSLDFYDQMKVLRQEVESWHERETASIKNKANRIVQEGSDKAESEYQAKQSGDRASTSPKYVHGRIRTGSQRPERIRDKIKDLSGLDSASGQLYEDNGHYDNFTFENTPENIAKFKAAGGTIRRDQSAAIKREEREKLDDPYSSSGDRAITSSVTLQERIEKLNKKEKQLFDKSLNAIEIIVGDSKPIWEVVKGLLDGSAKSTIASIVGASPGEVKIIEREILKKMGVRTTASSSLWNQFPNENTRALLKDAIAAQSDKYKSANLNTESVPDNQPDLFSPPKPKDNPITVQSKPLTPREKAIAKAIRKEEQRLYKPRKVSFAPKSTGKKKTEAEKVREIKDLITEHEALVAEGKIPVPTYSTSTPPLSGFTPTAKAYIAESLLRVAPGLKEPAPVDLLSNTAYETLKQIQKGFNSKDGSLVAAIESLSHRKPSDDILKKDEDKRIAAKELMKMGIIVKSRTRNGKQEYALNADTKDEIPSMDLEQKPLAPNEGEFLSINIPGASSFNVRNTPRAILAFLKGAGIKPEELEDLSDRLKTLSFAERRGITRFEVLKLKGLARHINYCFEPSQRGNTGRGFGLVC